MGARAVQTYYITKRVTTADLTVATTAYSIAFDDAIQPYDVVTGAHLDLETKFNWAATGAGGSTCALDVGDGTDADGYIDNFAIGRAATAGVYSTPTTAPALLENSDDVNGSTAKTPTVKLTGSASLDGYTTGSVIVVLRVDRVPGGRSWK
jgi:hypothetical protein